MKNYWNLKGRTAKVPLPLLQTDIIESALLTKPGDSLS